LAMRMRSIRAQEVIASRKNSAVTPAMAANSAAFFIDGFTDATSVLSFVYLF